MNWIGAILLVANVVLAGINIALINQQDCYAKRVHK